MLPQATHCHTHYHLHPFHFVGSHLSELQLSEHVSYLNVFSKATPTISGYFWQWKAGRSCSNGWYQGFQCSLYPLYGSWKHRITSKGKVGFSGKVKATVKVSCWVPLACCSVQKQTCRVRRCITHQWLQHVSSSVIQNILVIRIPSGPMCLDKWLSTVFKSKDLVAKQHTRRYNCMALHCTNTPQRYNTVDQEIFAVKNFFASCLGSKN